MIIIGLIVMGFLALFFALLFWGSNRRLKTLEANHRAVIASERTLAIESSRTAIRGRVSEQIIPLLPGFPYELGYCKFLGQPVDYIVFNGMNGIMDNIEGAKMEIIIAEVKTGVSQLSKIQRAIRRAVKEGRVRFEEWNIDADNKIKIKNG